MIVLIIDPQFFMTTTMDLQLNLKIIGRGGVGMDNITKQFKEALHLLV